MKQMAVEMYSPNQWLKSWTFIFKSWNKKSKFELIKLVLGCYIKF